MRFDQLNIVHQIFKQKNVSLPPQNEHRLIAMDHAFLPWTEKVFGTWKTLFANMGWSNDDQLW